MFLLKMHQNGSNALAKADCKELEGAVPPVALPRFSGERVTEGLASTSSFVFKYCIQYRAGTSQSTKTNSSCSKGVRTPLVSQQQMGCNQQHLTSSVNLLVNWLEKVAGLWIQPLKVFRVFFLWEVGEKVPFTSKYPWQLGIKARFIQKMMVAYCSQQRQGCVWTLLLLHRQDWVAGSGWPGQIRDSGQEASAARKQEQNSYLCMPDWKPDGLRSDPNWKGKSFKKGVKKDTCCTSNKSSIRLKNLALCILLDDNIPPHEKRGEDARRIFDCIQKKNNSNATGAALCSVPSSPLRLPQLLGQGRRLARLRAQP